MALDLGDSGHGIPQIVMKTFISWKFPEPFKWNTWHKIPYLVTPRVQNIKYIWKFKWNIFHGTIRVFWFWSSFDKLSPDCSAMNGISTFRSDTFAIVDLVCKFGLSVAHWHRHTAVPLSPRLVCDTTSLSDHRYASANLQLMHICSVFVRPLNKEIVFVGRSWNVFLETHQWALGNSQENSRTILKKIHG